MFRKFGKRSAWLFCLIIATLLIGLYAASPAVATAMKRVLAPASPVDLPDEGSSPAGHSSGQPVEACLTRDSWQAALVNPRTVPAGLPGRFFAQSEGVYYFANPDGTGKQVVQGLDSFGDISAHGSHLLYTHLDQQPGLSGFYVYDVLSGASHRIPNVPADYSELPQWLPDGTHITFQRTDDGSLYTIGRDGDGLQKLLGGGDYDQVIAWSADGRALFYGIGTRDGYSLRKLDLPSGTVTELFPMGKSWEPRVSPEAGRVSFFEDLTKVSSGLYVSDLTGADRRLIGQIDHAYLSGGSFWSPDGKWLIVGLTEDLLPHEQQWVLVGIDTCQVIPLPFNGEHLEAWLPQ